VLIQIIKNLDPGIFKGLYRIGIESIQPNMNSSTNKQVHCFAYFDKHYALLTLKLFSISKLAICFMHIVNNRLFR